MRAFLGIDFDRNIKEELRAVQQSFRNQAFSGRWKHIDNFHLTLKFFNDIDHSQKSEIDSIMKHICETTKPFGLKFTAPGTFNGRDSVRVLWIGLGGERQQLGNLHKTIESELETAGFPAERRRYNPHITIGQDIIFDMDFDEVCKKSLLPPTDIINVEQLYLFKSEQIGNRRIYTKISEYELLGH